MMMIFSLIIFFTLCSLQDSLASKTTNGESLNENNYHQLIKVNSDQPSFSIFSLLEPKYNNNNIPPNSEKSSGGNYKTSSSATLKYFKCIFEKMKTLVGSEKTECSDEVSNNQSNQISTAINYFIKTGQSDEIAKSNKVNSKTTQSSTETETQNLFLNLVNWFPSSSTFNDFFSTNTNNEKQFSTAVSEEDIAKDLFGNITDNAEAKISNSYINYNDYNIPESIDGFSNLFSSILNNYIPALKDDFTENTKNNVLENIAQFTREQIKNVAFTTTQNQLQKAFTNVFYKTLNNNDFALPKFGEKDPMNLLNVVFGRLPTNNQISQSTNLKGDFDNFDQDNFDSAKLTEGLQELLGSITPNVAEQIPNVFSTELQKLNETGYQQQDAINMFNSIFLPNLNKDSRETDNSQNQTGGNFFSSIFDSSEKAKDKHFVSKQPSGLQTENDVFNDLLKNTAKGGTNTITQDKNSAGLNNLFSNFSLPVLNADSINSFWAQMEKSGFDGTFVNSTEKMKNNETANINNLWNLSNITKKIFKVSLQELQHHTKPEHQGQDAMHLFDSYFSPILSKDDIRTENSENQIGENFISGTYNRIKKANIKKFTLNQSSGLETKNDVFNDKFENIAKKSNSTTQYKNSAGLGNRFSNFSLPVLNVDLIKSSRGPMGKNIFDGTLVNSTQKIKNNKTGEINDLWNSSNISKQKFNVSFQELQNFTKSGRQGQDAIHFFESIFVPILNKDNIKTKNSENQTAENFFSSIFDSIKNASNIIFTSKQAFGLGTENDVFKEQLVNNTKRANTTTQDKYSKGLQNLFSNFSLSVLNVDLIKSSRGQMGKNIFDRTLVNSTQKIKNNKTAELNNLWNFSNITNEIFNVPLDELQNFTKSEQQGQDAIHYFHSTFVPNLNKDNIKTENSENQTAKQFFSSIFNIVENKNATSLQSSALEMENTVFNDQLKNIEKGGNTVTQDISSTALNNIFSNFSLPVLNVDLLNGVWGQPGKVVFNGTLANNTEKIRNNETVGKKHLCNLNASLEELQNFTKPEDQGEGGIHFIYSTSVPVINNDSSAKIGNLEKQEVEHFVSNTNDKTKNLGTINRTPSGPDAEINSFNDLLKKMVYAGNYHIITKVQNSTEPNKFVSNLLPSTFREIFANTAGKRKNKQTLKATKLNNFSNIMPLTFLNYFNYSFLNTFKGPAKNDSTNMFNSTATTAAQTDIDFANTQNEVQSKSTVQQTQHPYSKNKDPTNVIENRKQQQPTTHLDSRFQDKQFTRFKRQMVG